MGFGDIVFLIIVGLVVGGLGRLAVPGPDPMPIWATILLGLVGAFVGGAIAVALDIPGGMFVVSVLVATLLVIAYRRFVQKRGVTGPDARRMP